MADILLIATGGTIAMRKNERGKVVPAVKGGDLLNSLPQVKESAAWEVIDFSNTASCNISPDRMLEIARIIQNKLAQDAGLKGVVITHGTDTLEETAFFLNVTIDDPRPIVLTASQRDASEKDSDGPRNLLNAMRAVLDPQALDRGVLLCLNEKIHAARDVRKLHTSRLDAFSSGEMGALGSIDGDRVIWHRKPEATVKLGLPPKLAEVGICKAYTGMGAGLLNRIREPAWSGLVIEAFGRGNVPPEIVPEIEKFVHEKMAVVITSRCLFGQTGPVYGYPGGGADLEKAGAWFAADLSPEKARLLLSIACGNQIPLGIVKEIMQNGGKREKKF